ncbi:hypothetical protein D3C87_1939680 [compost metagenome]
MKNGLPTASPGSDEAITLPAASSKAAFQPGDTTSRLTAFDMLSALRVRVRR